MRPVFFFRILIFCLLLVLTDLLLGTFFQSFYKSSRYGILGRQVYCFSRSDEDMLILGPSTASHNYVPSILGDSLGISCYNAGSDGMAVYYHYAVLSNYKGARKPQLVVYDLSTLDWYKSNTLTFTLEAALDRLSPHYGEIPELDTLFALNGQTEKVKQYSSMYRFNSKLVQLIKCHWIPSYEDAGYEALQDVMPVNAVMEVHEGGGVEEKEKIQYLQKLIDYTKVHHIRLIMVISPKYYRLQQDDYRLGKEIAARNNIPVIDLMNAPELMKPEYFADEAHLNDRGARLFTALVGKEIRKMMEGGE